MAAKAACYTCGLWNIVHHFRTVPRQLFTGQVNGLTVQCRHKHSAVLDQYVCEQPLVLERQPIELLKVQPPVVVGVVYMHDVSRGDLRQAVGDQTLMVADQTLHFDHIEEAVAVAVKLLCSGIERVTLPGGALFRYVRLQ